jgi:PBSX family phage terminase large subunit
MMKKIKAGFKFKPFSKKQKRVLTWWMDDSPVKDKEGIIANGAIRSGKTLSMSLSFVMWAMYTFAGSNFAMCGKTIGSFRRNVVFWLKIMLRCRGYHVEDKRTENLLIIRKKGKENYFYIFGGKDERSQDLIQGITLAGIFFDEVALMPESFVKQATGRCSVDGSKFWFNCNPEGPYHYFKLEWINKADELNILVLNFTMDDNLSLTEKVKERYRKMYTGLFYKRFILGLWVLAEGIIYDMFNDDKHIVKTEDREYSEYYVSCDYGTFNPCCFGLYGKADKWYKIKEYYHDGRMGKQKTDEEYVNDFINFIGDVKIRAIVIDPTAASFITSIKKKSKWTVIKAKNDVLEGIRNYANALNNGLIAFNDCCTHSFREFSSYIWDVKASEHGEDKPLKQNDHTKDEERYFINTVVSRKRMGW